MSLGALLRQYTTESFRHLLDHLVEQDSSCDSCYDYQFVPETSPADAGDWIVDEYVPGTEEKGYVDKDDEGCVEDDGSDVETEVIAGTPVIVIAEGVPGVPRPTVQASVPL